MSLNVFTVISLAVVLLLAQRGLGLPRRTQFAPVLRVAVSAAFGMALASSRWPLAVLYALVLSYELYAATTGLEPGRNPLR
ncbi:MAG TPA: hypothetical protein VFN55_05075 [Solirubrobacteraceae bacterium]|nr:hypothetical protein [Solirubrobacteraceae bacterium]